MCVLICVLICVLVCVLVCDHIPAQNQAEAFFASGVTMDSFGSDQYVEGEAGVDVLVTSAGIGRFGNIEDLR